MKDIEQIPDAQERMLSLLGEFKSLRDSRQGERLSRMKGLMRVFEERPFTPDDFNSLAVCRVGTDEVRHSAILAWMLDARESHGQGSLFLDAFLRACEVPAKALPSGRYYVRTEFSGVESIIDVLVYRPKEFLLYIENKVLAAEGEDQVDREFRDMRRQGEATDVHPSKQFAVFLTPAGCPPVSGDPSNWIAVSYWRVAEEFSGILDRLVDEKVKGFVRDWIATVELWR